MAYIFRFEKTYFTPVYSPSDSSESEEFPKSPVTCQIAYFQCIYILLKTLADNSFHLFLRAESKLITTKQLSINT